MVRRYDNVAGALRERQNGIYVFASDYDRLAKLARELCMQIEAEGGKGYRVHDMARSVLKELGEVSGDES